jgi:hypothetical protein
MLNVNPQVISVTAEQIATYIGTNIMSSMIFILNERSTKQRNANRSLKMPSSDNKNVHEPKLSNSSVCYGLIRLVRYRNITIYIPLLQFRAVFVLRDLDNTNENSTPHQYLFGYRHCSTLGAARI